MSKKYDLGQGDLEGMALHRFQRKLFKYEKESRFLTHERDSIQAREEVFDKNTLMNIYDLSRRGFISYLNGVVKAGKESRVYWGVKPDDSDVAVKIHLVSNAEFKKRMNYIAGDPRFTRIKKGMANLVNLWANKEFKNLRAAYDNGIPVPEPITVKKNVVLMEFMGKNGVSSPLLAESEVKDSDYNRLIKLVAKVFSKSNLVHADLSEYNVFKSNGKLIMLDFGSAVDISHPMAREFLRRDLYNINRFFIRRGVNVTETDDLMEMIMPNDF